VQVQAICAGQIRMRGEKLTFDPQEAVEKVYILELLLENFTFISHFRQSLKCEINDRGTLWHF